MCRRGATNIRIDELKIIYTLEEAGYIGDHIIQCVPEYNDYTIDLPPGISVDWAKLATEVSEEEAAELCPPIDFIFIRSDKIQYQYYDFMDISNCFDTALESLFSLCRSQSKDPKKTIVVKIKM